MKTFLMIIGFVLAMASSGQVNAGLITVSVDQETIAVGETVELTLSATDFDEFDFFDVDINFDTALFSVMPETFESNLSEFSLVWSQLTGGLAISFVDFFPTSGDFLLAKLDLTALKSGSTNFDLVVDEFALSDPLDIFAPATPINVEVAGQAFTSVTSVPEPGTLSIMCLALMALISRYRKVSYIKFAD